MCNDCWGGKQGGCENDGNREDGERFFHWLYPLSYVARL
jgi:hypothetical protein